MGRSTVRLQAHSRDFYSDYPLTRLPAGRKKAGWGSRTTKGRAAAVLSRLKAEFHSGSTGPRNQHPRMARRSPAAKIPNNNSSGHRGVTTSFPLSASVRPPGDSRRCSRWCAGSSPTAWRTSSCSTCRRCTKACSPSSWHVRRKFPSSRFKRGRRSSAIASTSSPPTPIWKSATARST